MARCLLCSASVDDLTVTCPACGGAVADDDDVTWVAPSSPPGADAWGTPAPPPAAGVDLGKAPSAGEPAPWPPADPYGPAPLAPDPYGPAPYAPDPYASDPYAPVPYGAPPPGPAGYPPGAPWGYAPPRPTEGLATAALITSIAGLVLGFACMVGWIACPVGAVMGHTARRRIAETGHQGDGMALAAIICGWVGTGIGVLIVVFYAVFIGGFLALGATTG